jgi:hypothetical protein
VDYYEFEGDWIFYYHCEVLCSSWFLKELFELMKLILWRSNNQTYHLDSREILRFLGVVFQSFVVLVFNWLGDGSRLNKSCLHDLGVPYHHCYRVSSPLLVEFISEVPNLQMQAMLGEMRRILRAKLEPINERLDRVEAGTPWGQQQNIPNRQRGGRALWRNDEEEVELEDFDEPYLNRGRFEHGYGNREVRMGRPRRDNDLGNIKIKILSFQGKNDPGVYLEWETKMEMVFLIVIVTRR